VGPASLSVVSYTQRALTWSGLTMTVPTCQLWFRPVATRQWAAAGTAD